MQVEDAAGFERSADLRKQPLQAFDMVDRLMRKDRIDRPRWKCQLFQVCNMVCHIAKLLFPGEPARLSMTRFRQIVSPDLPDHSAANQGALQCAKATA